MGAKVEAGDAYEGRTAKGQVRWKFSTLHVLENATANAAQE